MVNMLSAAISNNVFRYNSGPPIMRSTWQQQRAKPHSNIASHISRTALLIVGCEREYLELHQAHNAHLPLRETTEQQWHTLIKGAAQGASMQTCTWSRHTKGNSHRMSQPSMEISWTCEVSDPDFTVRSYSSSWRRYFSSATSACIVRARLFWRCWRVVPYQPAIQLKACSQVDIGKKNSLTGK